MSRVNRIVIIIPTLNEVDSASNLINSIFFEFPKISILVVDDGSKDGTAESVRDLKNRYENLFLIERSNEKGLGSAYRCGFEFAQNNDYKYVIQMDADGSHQVANLMNLVYAPLEIDAVVGSRYVKGGGILGWGLKRKLISKFGNYFARFMLRIKIKDSTSGFKRLSEKVFCDTALRNSKTNGYAFQIEILHACKLRNYSQIEVPITFIDRRFGTSKFDKFIFFEAFFNVIKWTLKKS